MSATNLVAALLSLLNSEPDTSCLKTCKPSESGLQFTAQFEGYRPFNYGDPVNIRTIGYGHVIRPGEHFVEPLMPPDAFLLLQKDAGIAARGVNRSVAISLRQSQFDALNDFQFNTGALGKSTLLKRVNAGHHEQVPTELQKWVYAKGQRLPGLETRRTAEGDLYGR